MAKKQQPVSGPDFIVENHGSIFILTARTDAAKNWVEEFLPEDRQTWGPDGTVVEHRFIRDIVDGILGDGLEVR
jgi:hypothetical protein